MLKELFSNVPILVISIIATITGGTAISKVAQEFRPALDTQTREILEVSAATPTPIVPTTLSATPTVKPGTNTVAAATTFTRATLATHNTSGNCYVAFRGIVYDVSAHPSWQNCVHHGTRGGQDITSIFPHSTNYFSTLPKVGTLQGGSTGASSSASRSGDDNNEDENEDENEQEDEQKDDDHEVEDEVEEHEDED